jgi:hypothetical protein
MARLVVEQMTARHVRRLYVFCPSDYSCKRTTGSKSAIEAREERLFPRPRAVQTEKVIVHNLV